MVSIRKLEKMLEPYWIGMGASSVFTDYNEYRKDGKTVRVDEDDIRPFGGIPYKQTLLNAAKELKLIT